ncbi:MAG: ABC transporter substrate-binding protein [Ignisphaera sp.]
MVLKIPIYVLLVIAVIVAGVAGYIIIGSTLTKPMATVTQTPTTYRLSGEIRIGVLLPLSGELSSFGAELKTIIEYAEQEINNYLNSSKKPWRIKFIIEDTAVDPRTHLEKLMALYATGIRIFIGGISSSELSESLSYCNERNILLISPSSTSPALSIPDMALRYVPPDQYQGKAIAKILWERGLRWIIPMWRGDTWGDGLSQATIETFKEICKSSGESCGVLQGIRYDPKAKEFTTEVSQLASLVDDAVKNYGKDKVGVLLISFEEAAAVFAAAKNYPILAEVKWQGSDGTANIAPLLDPGIADMIVKVEFLNTMASPGEAPKAQIVRNVIREKLGRDPMGYTYFTYDIAWTIALALDKAGIYDAVAVKNILPEVLKEYVGASGKIILDENGDRALAYYDIWTVVKVDNKYEWKVIGLYDGETNSVKWYS